MDQEMRLIAIPDLELEGADPAAEQLATVVLGPERDRQLLAEVERAAVGEGQDRPRTWSTALAAKRASTAASPPSASRRLTASSRSRTISSGSRRPRSAAWRRGRTGR